MKGKDEMIEKTEGNLIEESTNLLFSGTEKEAGIEVVN